MLPARNGRHEKTDFWVCHPRMRSDSPGRSADPMPDDVRMRAQRLQGGLRPVVLGVAALVVAGSAAVAMPGTACACSCAVSETPEAAVSHASGVFVGRATDKVSTGFTDIYEFEVSEVFKGDVGATTTVGTLSNGNGCGTRYEVGQEYLLFVSRPYDVDAAWEGNVCGPSSGGDVDVRAVTEQVYGPPREPSGSSAGISAWTRLTAGRGVPLVVGGVVALLAVWWGGTAIRRFTRDDRS